MSGLVPGDIALMVVPRHGNVSKVRTTSLVGSSRTPYFSENKSFVLQIKWQLHAIQ